MYFPNIAPAHLNLGPQISATESPSFYGGISE
mgnify:CR=1 FL=1